VENGDFNQGCGDGTDHLPSVENGDFNQGCGDGTEAILDAGAKNI